MNNCFKMYQKVKIVLLILYGFTLSDGFDSDWSLYESSFKDAKREELFIANAIADSNFKLNVSVDNWKTRTVGRMCYTAGIANGSMLVILFSTMDGLGIDITQKVFDLEVSASDFKFFHKRKNGKDQILVVVYSPEKHEFFWYTLDHYFLKKVSSWFMEKDISHFNIFKMGQRNMFIAITSNNLHRNTVDIYEFTSDTMDRWFYQSIPLSQEASSSCFSSIDSTIYLSIPQTNLNQLQIYYSAENHFIPYQNLSAPEINQVVCFENGFKSFLAFNGLNAGIYQFTEDGLTREIIENSNFEGIQFWLQIPVNTYRDETILLCQRQIDHATHLSLDVDIVTYNGNRFEEHEDIPCLLFGEQQNGLKCLTEYNPETGIRGSSYIAISDYLDLIVPRINDTALLFNLSMEMRKVENPAKKEFGSFLNLKNKLQTMIEDQNKEETLLNTQLKSSPNQINILQETPPVKSENSLLDTNDNKEHKIIKLRDEIGQVLREIESLNEEIDRKNGFKQKEGAINTIIFNGPVEIYKELQSERINSSLLDKMETDNLLNDIVRKNDLKFIEGHKTFTDLNAEEIKFDIINGISGDSFVINNDERMKVTGDLIFENLVYLGSSETSSKLVNGINIESEWINFDQSIADLLEFDQLRAENIFRTIILNNQDINEKFNKLSTSTDEFYVKNQTKSILISGNVTVKNLNGHNFENFLKKLCLKNVDCHIPRLKINGVMNVREGIKINDLNNLKFPEDYVSLESNEDVLDITGFKEFTNTARGYKVSTESTVNNIDLSKIITRTNEQNISSNITFADLEVASVLNVDGAVKGKEIENLVPNLGLKETNHVKSNVYFANLEVEGDIIIENSINGTNFTEYFQNIIYKDEQNAKINGSKTFSGGFTVLNNLHIDSDMINNIPLQSIISKDVSQKLHLNTILGTVDFEHLYVKGQFDGENVDDLNKSFVMLKGNDSVKSELIFLEPAEVEKFTFDSLNDLQLPNDTKNYSFSSMDTILNDINVEDLVVEGNVIGNIDKFDLKELRERYLSYTKNQIVSEPYYLHKLSVDYITPSKINDIESNSMFSYKKFKENVTDFLLYRKPNIESLNVEGTINIKTINNKSYDPILNNNVWMKMYHNGSSKEMTVDGNIYFDMLEIENLASANFDEFVSDLVFKNETEVEIQNSIVFENGIKVEKLIETKTLNDIAVENILRKDGEQTLFGPIEILGNVTVKDDLKIKGMINGVDPEYILNNFNMESNLTTIKGEVIFQRLAYIQNLIVNGTINGKDFENVKTKFVYTNGDTGLEKDIVFDERVHIHGNFGITNDINGINLSDFASRIVWITQDIDIEGPVRFTYPVQCYKFMNVDKQLNTQYLFGKNLEKHLQNGVFTDKGFLKGSFTFENIAINEYLNTKFINDLDLNNVITLKTNQSVESLYITEMTAAHDISVGNKVNGVNLVEESEITVLMNIEQDIPSEILFLNNVLIEDTLSALTINNKPTSRIVTTNTDQDLLANYIFNSKCWTDNHLVVHGLVNDINLTSWRDYAMSVDLEEPQKIERTWTVVEDLNLVGSINGDGIMNGLNMTKLVKDVKERESYNCDIERGISEDFKNLCTDITYIYENAKNQIYKFKFFEELQKISLSSNINYVKHFKHQEKHYLLINLYQDCHSYLYVFYENGFQQIGDVHTGVIDQAEIVTDKDDLFLVTRENEDSKDLICQIKFTTVVWVLKNGSLEIFSYLQNQELLQESQIPLTFYGLKDRFVTEFKIDKSSEISIRNYRKWEVFEENVAFFPRGLKTGLALRNGRNVIHLKRNDPVVDDYFDIDIEATIKGSVAKEPNFVVPGRVGGVLAVINVGMKKARKSLLAVASHKEAKVKHRLDIIEIYLDPFTGELFDKIPSYMPSSLTSIEFENGETLLTFLEENKILQIYEYKGIEGFKHRSSIKIHADHMFVMELPIEDKSRKVLALIEKNEIILLEAVMVGTRIRNDLKCAP